MRHIVVNSCYGGFSLSDAAIRHYAQLKGITLFIEDRDHSALLGPIYWTVPADQRPIQPEPWLEASREDRIAYNEAYSKARIQDSKIPRDDPALVETIQTLGSKANTQFSKLRIIEIPDDIEWEIEEYDGQEWVSEKHRTWH